jgi:quercetin dioxygenase-like cupin family protein
VSGSEPRPSEAASRPRDTGLRPMEADVRARPEREGLVPTTWGNGPHDRYAEHRHPYDKVLVAAAGSITFELPELGRDVPLAAGARLHLPAGTLHGAIVGPAGVTCLEAHLPAGTLGPEPTMDHDWDQQGEPA